MLCHFSGFNRINTLMRVILIFVLLTLSVFDGLFKEGQATGVEAAAILACEPVWKQAESPSLGEYSWLNGVSALSATNVWAVGYYTQFFVDRTLILHYDGAKWKRVASPNPSLHSNELAAVDGTAANDVWAVGYSQDGNSGAYRTLTLHWNGLQWDTVPSPNVGTQANELFAVASISDTDAWAVGSYQDGSANHSLAMHWNGTDWTIVETPDTLSDTLMFNLRGVSAVASNDVWAVGFGTQTEPTQSGLVLHWDGINWAQFPGPTRDGSFFHNLQGVTAIAGNDFWAAGFVTTDPREPVTAHWNGSAWQSVESEGTTDMSNGLSSIAASSANNVWAVGGSTDPVTNDRLTLTMHWDGSGWTTRQSPNPGVAKDGAARFNTLNGVTTVSPNQAWAVGYYKNGNEPGKTLILQNAIPTGAPVRPELELPINGAVLTTRRVLLDWDDTNCATQYDVTVRQDSKTGAVVDSKTALGQSQFKTKRLARGHTYFWQVRACKSATCGKWSKWSHFSIE